MRSSADLPLVSAPVHIPRHGLLRNVTSATLTQMQALVASAVQRLHQRRRRAWRQDLPWDVGMDRLAEQANPTWVPRGW